jgi:hypothetical protein
MGDPKRLHDEWKKYKGGVAAEMIKQTKIKFDGGLGPALETLEKKWATPDGHKAAVKVKTVVGNYRKLLANVKAGKVGKDGTNGVTRNRDAWKMQIDKAEVLFKQMDTVANNHKVDPSKR